MKKQDPKELGIPNINFSIYTGNDPKRNKKFKKQRIERGFDDSELWSLRDVYAKFMLPRLIEFRKKVVNIIEVEETYLEDLDYVIDTFKIIIENDSILDLKTEKRITKGLYLFSDMYLTLWT